MILPFWSATHQLIRLLLRLALRPFDIPGQLVLDEEGAHLRMGRETQSLRWADVEEVRIRRRTLEAESARASTGEERQAKALLAAGEALAAKNWELALAGRDKQTICVTSWGFERPLRQAQPKLRAFLQARLDVRLSPLAEAQTVEPCRGTPTRP